MRLTKSAQLDYLVRRKFPEVYSLQNATLLAQRNIANRARLETSVVPDSRSPPLANLARQALAEIPQMPDMPPEMAAYRMDLESKSSNDLQTLFNAEKSNEKREHDAAIEAQIVNEDRQRFFHQPAAEAYFEHWAKAAFWTIDEGVALVLGKEPGRVTWENVSPLTKVSLFAGKYERVRDLAMRAMRAQQLSEHVSPGVFLAWAQRNGVVLPSDLVKQVEEHGIIVADWKDCYDKLKVQFDVLLVDRDRLASISMQLIEERNALRTKLESNHWEFDEASDTYPRELDIAMQVWRVITLSTNTSNDVKKSIKAWLSKNWPDLSAEAKERIAVICNWNRQGGARKVSQK